jgi:N-acetylglucosaminyldiphosphoundecaprenol N-acetyl-beta-D-mannosaminyltransferase
MTDRVLVLGIPLSVLTPDQAVAHLHSLLTSSGQHHVMTPNNEMLVYATSHPEFTAILRRTTLNLPDSTGVVWAMRRAGAAIKTRVTGVDTVMHLCQELSADEPVFLLGGRDGVAAVAAAVLQGRNPSLRIVGTAEGSPAPADAPGLIAQINQSGARLLLVAYGAPQQDVWIARHLQLMREFEECPSVSSVRSGTFRAGTPGIK